MAIVLGFSFCILCFLNNLTSAISNYDFDKAPLYSLTLPTEEGSRNKSALAILTVLPAMKQHLAFYFANATSHLMFLPFWQAKPLPNLTSLPIPDRRTDVALHLVTHSFLH